MNFLIIKTNLITNFKPNYNNSNIKNIFYKNNTSIYCKNFFLFLLLIKYKSNYSGNTFLESSIFIKPLKRKVYTILRSPYRHKLARHQLSLKRYNIVSTIKIPFEITSFNNFTNFITFFNFLIKFYYSFESNLIFVHKLKIIFPFFYSYNFNLKIFK